MIAIIRALQESVSSAVATYMAKEKIGFNELPRRLDTSSCQTSRLLKGKANLTMASIAELAADSLHLWMGRKFWF
jgi:antitoxin component HigA of HigAB toxin-antitoxin module